MYIVNAGRTTFNPKRSGSCIMFQFHLSNFILQAQKECCPITVDTATCTKIKTRSRIRIVHRQSWVRQYEQSDNCGHKNRNSPTAVGGKQELSYNRGYDTCKPSKILVRELSDNQNHPRIVGTRIGTVRQSWFDNRNRPALYENIGKWLVLIDLINEQFTM